MRISDWSSDVCSSDLMGSDQADDAFGLSRFEPVAGIDATFAQPVKPQHAVRIDHDLDDLSIGKRRRDGRPHRRAQHRAPAALRLDIGRPAHDVASLAFASGFAPEAIRSEEQTSELQSLMRISYAVFCLKKKIITEK